MNPFETALITLAALLPIVNPLGTAPIFLAMTADLPPAARHRLAAVVARNAFVLLTVGMLAGSHVLAFFGISLPVVRVAGGMVLLATGWRLLHAGDASDGPVEPVTTAWDRELKRRGFYPLTFPLTVGPGSLSIAITLGAGVRTDSALTLLRAGANTIGIAAVAVVVYLCYRFASKVIGALGETGTSVFLRLSAFILLCVGVAILWSGIAGLVATLP